MEEWAALLVAAGLEELQAVGMITIQAATGTVEYSPRTPHFQV
jgi:hypothetical protein